MTEAESDLLELLRRRSVRRGEFRLASGAVDVDYIDGKLTSICSEGVHLIGEVLYERTAGLDVEAIGGPQVGAVPLTVAAVAAYHRHGRRMEGFWVRGEIKGHGTRRRIEGGLRPGARVVIVDDVVTGGGSALGAVAAVREIGCRVVAVVALVDRLRGAGESFRRHGIGDYRAIFTAPDLGVGGRSPGGADPRD